MKSIKEPNPRTIPIGEVAYYVQKDGYKRTVGWGIVDSHYSDGIVLQLYDLVDARIINGVHMKEFVNNKELQQRWHKLPKGWTYNTELYTLEWSRLPHVKSFIPDVKNKDYLKAAIEYGLYVKVQDNTTKYLIQTEVTKDKGYRVYTKYEAGYYPSYVTLNPFEIYETYDETHKAIEEYEAELKRQSELTDEEWSIEQIDKTLDRAERLGFVTEHEKNQYREWLHSRDKVEDIETRIFDHAVQWKRWNNKKWLNIEV